MPLDVLNNYEMRANNVYTQKQNGGDLLGVNKTTGQLELLRHDLFTKGNFFKKFLGAGPLSNYKLSLKSIRSHIDHELSKKESSLEEKSEKFKKNVSIIMDKHKKYDRNNTWFYKTAKQTEVTVVLNEVKEIGIWKKDYASDVSAKTGKKVNVTVKRYESIYQEEAKIGTLVYEVLNKKNRRPVNVWDAQERDNLAKEDIKGDKIGKIEEALSNLGSFVLDGLYQKKYQYTIESVTSS